MDEHHQKRNLIPLKKALEKGGSAGRGVPLINEGKIVAYRMEGQTMVDADSIEAYQLTLPRIEPGGVKQAFR